MLGALLVLAVAWQDPWPAHLAVPSGTADSTSALTLTEFQSGVLATHPVARQARLLEDAAAAEVLAAKGAVYDPTVSVSWAWKTYSATQYYNYVDAALKIPTPIGVQVKLGYEKSTGSFINPDQTTPSSGLLSAGVSVPLGRGLVTDRRRTALAQAKALRSVASADRQAAVNKLLYSATKEYAQWYEAWRRLSIAQQGLELADVRWRAVTRRFEDGDAAAIDTVEAGLERQRRLITMQEAANGWYAATLGVNAYLWGDHAEPVDLAPGVVPTVAGVPATPLDPAMVDAWLAEAMVRHPELAKALGKLSQQDANRRLYGQELLPFIEAEASALRAGSNGLFEWPTLDQNYKASLAAETPLLLMSARGRNSASQAKAESAALEVDVVRRDIQLTALVAVNDVRTLERLLSLQATAVAQARLLRDGESRRFDAGESTLFVVNQRDRLLLDELVKQATFEAKYASARGLLALALGVPVLPGS